MNKKIFFCFGLILGFLLGAFFFKERLTIIIEEPIELLHHADIKESPGNNVLSILKEGTNGDVIATTYSKEFMFLRIRTSNGQFGYILWDPRKMTIFPTP